MSNLGNKKIMADNLLYYMNRKGISRGDLCRDLDFKYTTVTGWLVAEKYPRIDKIEIMAHYFGITKADLVEEKAPSATTEKAFVDMYIEAFGHEPSTDDIERAILLLRAAHEFNK